MNASVERVWDSLLEAGVVEGPAPESRAPDSPWYLKVLLGFSGWLGGLFLLGFIGIGYEVILENSTASFLTGAFMIGGAYAVLRIPKNEFVEHLALAVSLAGQILVGWALFETTRPDEATPWTLLAIIQGALAAVMPSFVHRVFSSYIAAFAFSVALGVLGAGFVFSAVVLFAAAWLWLDEFRYPRHMGAVRAVGYGLVLALIQIESTHLFAYETMGLRSFTVETGSWVRPWMGEVLAGAVTLYVVWRLLERGGQGISERPALLALLGTLVLCAASIEAPGIALGVVIMLLGYAGGNRVLLGLGIASLIFYVSAYYYLLEATLLAKSQTLLIVGLVLLAGRWLTQRLLPRESEASHG